MQDADREAITQLSNIRDKAVHVWAIDLVGLAEKYQLLYSFLSSDERSRASSFLVESAHRQYVLTRGALRSILSLYVARAPEMVTIEYGDHGKPYYPHRLNNLDLQFNISHSADMALCAMSRGAQVGIDIEKISSKESLSDLSNMIFTREERRVMAYLKQDWLESFFECWTYKEAYVKAVGRGLSLDPKDFDVSDVFISQGGTLVDREDRSWCFVRLPIRDDYRASLVVEARIDRVILHQFDI